MCFFILLVIRYLDASNLCLIRIEHSNAQITRFALSRIRRLFNTPCTLNPLLFTGTIRKCEELIVKSGKSRRKTTTNRVAQTHQG